MKNLKSSSLKNGNETLKEAPIRTKFDTSGFLYSPHQVKLDKQAQRVYLIENTLRDVARDELMSNAVIWLLGYDARYPINDQISNTPIRAQAEGSHWETGWCIIHFLDARPILADRYPLIVQEIDRRFCSDEPQVNPLGWLLAEAIKQDEERSYWYGKEYDTAVVTFSLLRAQTEQQLKLPQQLKIDLDQLLSRALQWIYTHLEDVLEIGKVDEEAIFLLIPLIYADEHFASTLSKRWRESYKLKQERLYILLDRWLSYLEAHLAPNRENLLNHFPYNVNTASCLCRLVFTQQHADARIRKRFQPFAERSKLLLLYYIEILEEWAARDRWGGTFNIARQLGAYVTAYTMIGSSSLMKTNSPNESVAGTEVVLKMLSTVKNAFFSNGSMYHSVYATVYFLHSLIAVWDWPDAKKTIIQLNHELLDRSVVKPSVERKESFKLQRLLIERENDLIAGKKQYSQLLARERKKRYALLVTLFVTTTVCAVFCAHFFLGFIGSDTIRRCNNNCACYYNRFN